MQQPKETFWEDLMDTAYELTYGISLVSPVPLAFYSDRKGVANEVSIALQEYSLPSQDFVQNSALILCLNKHFSQNLLILVLLPP